MISPITSQTNSSNQSVEEPYIHLFDLEQNGHILPYNDPKLNQNQIFTVRYTLIYCEGMNYYLTINGSSPNSTYIFSDLGSVHTQYANITKELKIEQIGSYSITLMIRNYNYTSGKFTNILTNSFEFEIVKYRETDINLYLLIVSAICFIAIIGILLYNNFIEKIASRTIQKYVSGSNLDPSIQQLIAQDIFLSNKEVSSILSRIKKSSYIDVSLDEIEEKEFIKSIKR
ncbi:hypothetical protein [Candidatus Lokiarchaeum ossiferum]|uniref:hypothetical protein n=1 Tax=Candidatus Lokiarchaeum ossiferum TaxID=2951803 RepID=UPI00352E256B